jgi:DNA-directed RNA polymerase subunit F
MEVVNEEDVSIPESHKIMDERKKVGELGYEQKICLEYLEKIPKVSDAKFKSLVEELSKIDILKPRYIALIVNMMPDTEEEMIALFSKERTNLKKEEIKHIIDIVKKYNK